MINLYVLGPFNIFWEVADALEMSLKELGYKVNRAYNGYLKGFELRALEYEWSISNPDKSPEDNPYTQRWDDGEWIRKFHGFPYTTEGINIFLVGAIGILQNPQFNLPRKSINILYNFEQPMIPNYGFNYTLNIFDNGMGVYCPIGWSKAFETNIVVDKEDTDVFHMGMHAVSRGNIPVDSQRLYYSERDKKIMSSKINLITRKSKTYRFPILRYLLIACKKSLSCLRAIMITVY